MPCEPVRVHPLKYAGVSVPEKLASVRKLVLEARASSLVVMAMDEVSQRLCRGSVYSGDILSRCEFVGVG